MNPYKDIGSPWPAKDDLLLLKAILIPHNEAIKAWEKWLQVVNIDTLEAGTQRLFPLLYVKLKSYNISHPLMNTFKGIYRQTWYKNQIIFHNAVPVLERFKDTNINCIILKGAALTVLYYKDLGLRHMSDFDIMVHWNDVEKAMNILQISGYLPTEKHFQKYNEKKLYFQHSLGFKHKKHQNEIDLHWHILPENCGIHDDDSLWEHKQTIKINHFTTYTLDATDHLMHVCVHGLKYNTLTPIRWVTDAAIIIEHDNIHWDRLFEEIKRRNIVLPILKTFTYLHDELKVNIPDKVLQTLSNIKINKIEYLGESIYGVKKKEIPSLGEVFRWYKYMYYRYTYTMSQHKSIYLSLILLANFFEYHWRLTSSKQVPAEIIKRSWKSTRRHIRNTFIIKEKK